MGDSNYALRYFLACGKTKIPKSVSSISKFEERVENQFLVPGSQFLVLTIVNRNYLISFIAINDP